MKKNKLSSYMLVISIFSLITTFVFIVQKSYDSLMSPINEAKQSIIIKPIDPNLDLSTLSEIENRAYYNSDTSEPAIASPSSSQ